MRKTALFVILVLITGVACAQKARLNAYGSYVFDDSYDAYYDNNNYYNGKVKGGFQYGGGLEYMIQPHYCIELMYLGRTAHAPTTYQGGIASTYKSTSFDVNLNYLMLGSDTHRANPNGKVEGYGGIFAGALFMNVDNPESGKSASATKFAWLMRLGANIWASPKVGIKLQTQLVSSVDAVGGTVYFGTGGAGVGLSTYSTLFQFGIGGGLTFKLGK